MPLSPTLAGEYLICKRRGHQPPKGVHMPIDGFVVCTWCGTHFRTVQVATLEEKNIPTEAEECRPN